MSVYSQDGISLILSSHEAGGICTLLLDRKENRFNPSLVTDISSALDTFDSIPHPKALVIRGKGKFFSNGLDLDFMMSNPTDTNPMIESVWRLLGRILVMDCRTVAAINGHAFGAGLFLALACDYRLMRTQRGYVNWPELNLGMRLAKGFAELTKAKVTNPMVLREGVLTGRRYGSGDAVQAGLVDEECSEERLALRAEEMAAEGLPKSLRLANFDPDSLRSMKMELYTDAYRALTLASVDATPESRL